MPSLPPRPAPLAWQVFRGSDAVRRGLLTEHQLRGSAWIRLRRDVYADARLDRDHALACRAVAYQLPAGAAIAGPSAAHLYGVVHAADFTDEVHVVAPRLTGLRTQPGLRVHTTDSAPMPTGQPPRTGPARAAWETAAWLPPVRAVAIIDTLLGSGLTSPTELSTLAAAYAARPGGRRAQRAFALADPAAQSPPESHLRVRLMQAGLPRPAVQHPVRVASGVLLHPDLAWPGFRVAIEYDGQWHDDAEQFHRDRRRLNLLAGQGWLVLHVTSRRLYREFPALLREVRDALTSRGWRP
ncbi:hypothetical protein [Plantactinospora sp. GCM10030261]|uniref:hypothetical protein n=1 Tax=Plantactinospora sp. GCM10030261 TaxID=3273420 RepID=UPI003610835B